MNRTQTLSFIPGGPTPPMSSSGANFILTNPNTNNYVASPMTSNSHSYSTSVTTPALPISEVNLDSQANSYDDPDTPVSRSLSRLSHASHYSGASFLSQISYVRDGQTPPYSMSAETSPRSSFSSRPPSSCFPYGADEKDSIRSFSSSHSEASSSPSDAPEVKQSTPKGTATVLSPSPAMKKIIKQIVNDTHHRSNHIHRTLLSYISGSDCKLFSDISGFFRVTTDDLDQLVRLAGSLKALLRCLQELDKEGRKFSSMQSLCEEFRTRSVINADQKRDFVIHFLQSDGQDLFRKDVEALAVTLDVIDQLIETTNGEVSLLCFILNRLSTRSPNVFSTLENVVEYVSSIIKQSVLERASARAKEKTKSKKIVLPRVEEEELSERKHNQHTQRSSSKGKSKRKKREQTRKG